MMRKRQAGLTLLEMLIALLLMSMLLVLLFGGLRLASRSWDAGASYTDNVAQTQLVESFLRRKISEVFPFRIKTSPSQPNAVFLGYGAGAHTLQFVAPMPAAGVRGGLYILRVGLAPSKKGQALMLWRTPVGASDAAASDAGTDAPVMLADHVAELNFSYFGVQAGSNAPPAWYPEWPDPTRAPQLVRMRLTLADGRQWPELVVAPRISMASSMPR